MICFRDMTFCTYHKECLDGDGCARALTEETRKQAQDWWDPNEKDTAPIAVFAEKPGCFAELEKKDG